MAIILRNIWSYIVQVVVQARNVGRWCHFGTIGYEKRGSKVKKQNACRGSLEQKMRKNVILYVNLGLRIF